MDFAVVVNESGRYITFVILDEHGNPQNYELLSGERIIDAVPPHIKLFLDTPGMIHPKWDGFNWVESASESEIALWESTHTKSPKSNTTATSIEIAARAFAATSTSIPDRYALDMPDLFPAWEDLLAAGNPLSKGTILRDGEQLYRVNQENVTPQAHQPPSSVGMTAVYVPINRKNAGTLADPIPAIRGMEYTYGLYYLDPEDQKIYLCKRDNEPEGGTVTLQYLPHEQTPHYFEAV